MSQDLVLKNVKSFLDIYCEQKGFKHVNLARSGSTNFLIRLQVEEAIKQNADYIVFSATSHDRIDIPVASRSQDIHWPITICDIEYRGYHSSSELLFKDNDVKIISDSINNWTENNNGHGNDRRKEIHADTITAMKHYVSHLHHFLLDQQKDYYVISDAIRKLQQLNKEFLFLRGPMFCDWDWVGKRFWGTNWDYVNRPQPWDIPFGTVDYTVNHNPQEAHDAFVKSMMEFTPTWKN